MPDKRSILEQMKRDELVAAVGRFELDVADRRVRNQLIDALAESPDSTMLAVLADMKRDRLKELCRALDLEDSGREKATLIDRLAGSAPVPTTAPPPAAALPVSVPPVSAPPAATASPADPPPADPPPATPRPATRREPEEERRPYRSVPYTSPPPPGESGLRSASDRPAKPPYQRTSAPYGRHGSSQHGSSQHGSGQHGSSRPSSSPRTKPINIQDSYLFEALKESRLLLFVLEDGRQLKGRIRRFDQYGMLVDTGQQLILVYKHAISCITEEAAKPSGY